MEYDIKLHLFKNEYNFMALNNIISLLVSINCCLIKPS